MRPFTDTAPKHMFPFHGRPFLEYLIEQLRDQGFRRIVLLLGYLADATREHFADGLHLGIQIDSCVTPPECETGERLRTAAPLLDPVFFLLYCDNYWPFHFHRLWQPFCSRRALAQMTVYENADQYSRPNAAIGSNGLVAIYDRSRSHPALHAIDIGYTLMDRSVLDLLPGGAVPLEAVYPELAARGQLGAYTTGHRYYSVGTPERLTLTRSFLSWPKAVLLDRDGVLNPRPPVGGYVRNRDEWHWLDGALEALDLFHEAGYRVIVCSNQAGVARGMVNQSDLAEIDRRMKQEARARGASIDAAYYCPHDWDSPCRCRKPKPGMLFDAQRDFHLDLTRTWFIGDDDRDAQAAEAAGCPFAMVSSTQSLLTIARCLIHAEQATTPWQTVS